MDVTLPNGQVIKGVPDGTTKAQLAQKLQANGMQVPKEWLAPTQPKAPEGGSRLLGGAEGDINALAKGVSSIPAGVAGAGGFLKGLLTPGENAGDTAENWMNNTNDFLNKTRFTIGTPEAQQGQNTQEGNAAAQQAITAIANAPQTIVDKGMAKVSELGNKLPWAPAVNKLINQSPALIKTQAALQGIGDIAANAAPLALGPRGVPGVPKAAPTAAADAIKLGYRVAPSDVALKGGSAPIGKVIEGLSGSPKLQVDASIKNQAVTNDLAAQDIGVPKGTALTPEVLDSAEQPHYKAYQAVKAIGTVPIDSTFKKNVASIGLESSDAFPMDSSPALEKLKQAYLQPDSFGANGAVLKIRQLRKDGNLNIASRDPEKMQLGYAQRQIANEIEDQIDRYASSRPEGFDNPNLIKNFRAARMQLAKINTIRDSITPGTTDVSAPYLAKQLNRGAPLSGNTLKIADTYNNFPSAMRPAGPLRNKVPVNALEGMLGGGSAIYGAAEHSPKAIATAAALLTGRPAARSLLLSSPYQNAMLGKPMSPYLRALIDPATLQALQTGNKQ